MSELLTIGAFAERTGLSRSALRFYDQNALLRPQLVDEETGYRYYATEQIALALLIGRLRAAEMPVQAVRSFLKAPLPQRARMLDQHRAALHARVDAADEIAGALHADLARAARGADGRWCTVDAKTFRAELERVEFAIASQDDRPELAVIWPEAREQSLRIVTTDSYRLTVRDLVPTAMGGQTLSGAIELARAREFADRLQAAGELTFWQGRDGALGASFTAEDYLVGDNRAGFPDYDRILSELPGGNQAAVAHHAFEDALATIGDQHDRVALRMSHDAVTAEAEVHSARTPTDWSGPEIVVWLDRRFLSEAVRASVGPDLAIEVIDPLSPVTLRSADTGTFNVLTMPVRPPD